MRKTPDAAVAGAPGAQSAMELEAVPLDALAAPAYIVDIGGRIIWANAAFAHLTGYKLEEVQGQPSTRYYVPEAETLFLARRHLMGQGKSVPLTLESVLIRRDGKQVPVELSASSLLRDGRIIGRLGILRVRPALTLKQAREAATHGHATPEEHSGPAVKARDLPWAPCWGLPAVVAALLCLVTLVVWHGLRRQEQESVQRTTAAVLQSAGTGLEHALEIRVDELVRLVRRWEYLGQLPQSQWEMEVALLQAYFPGYQAFGWLDTTFAPRWVAPPGDNTAALAPGATLDSHQHTTLEAVRDQRTPRATQAFTLARGGQGFAMYIPLFPGGAFQGVLGAVLQFAPLLTPLLQDVTPEYGVAVFEETALLYHRGEGDAPYIQTWGHEMTLRLLGVTWRVQVWPTPAALAQQLSLLPTVVLGTGMGLAGLIALVLHFSYAARQRGHEIAAAHFHLQQSHDALQELNVTLAQRVAERTEAIRQEFVRYRHTAQALHNSERRLQLALDAASIGIYEWHRTTGDIFCDDRLRKHWGLPPGAPTSYEIFMTGIHPDDRAATQAALALALDPQGNGLYHAEYRVIGLEDGVERWIEVRGHTLFEHGHAIRLVGTTLEITARKQAEAACSQQETAQRFLAEASALMATMLDVPMLVQRLAQLLVPTLGDWCSIDLFQDDGRLHRMAVVHADPARADLAEQLLRQSPILPTETSYTLTQALRTGKPCCEPAPSPAHLQSTARNIAAWEPIQALGLTVELVVPLQARGRVLGTITCVLSDHTRRYSTADLALAEDFAQRAALALDNVRLYQEAQAARTALQQTNASLERRVQERTASLQQTNHILRAEIAARQQAEGIQQQLLARLVTAQEEERRRLSYELHDHLGQSISALMLRLKFFETHSQRFDFQPIRALADTLVKDVHNLAWMLRPPELSNKGVEEALRDYVEEWTQHTGIPTDFLSRGFPSTCLPPHLEVTLYRLVQESLSNVLKHAQAQRVSVLLECHSEHVQAIVEDNGNGFDVAAALARPQPDKLGLTGMSERAALLGGTVELESIGGVGTTVFVRLPLLPQSAIAAELELS